MGGKGGSELPVIQVSELEREGIRRAAFKRMLQVHLKKKGNGCITETKKRFHPQKRERTVAVKG